MSGAELVKFPQGDAAWNVEFSHAAKTAADRHLKKVEVTQTGDYQRQRITWDDGAKAERWQINSMSYLFIENPNTGKFTPLPVTDTAAKQQTLHCDEQAFAWLDSKHQREPKPVKFQNQNCFHYQATITIRHHDRAADEEPVEYEAWIEEKTRQPVALTVNGEQRLFTFLPAPEEPLTPPAQVQKLTAYYRRVMGLPR